ncbi:MAG: hypothetical protein E3K40_03120 [Candidatus Brocadia sp.]|nr:hypothetical protein [Candidatus Brocadia sp.]MDG6025703.1 hypothetical protein [Candidatus Brocadia sp.]
MAPTITVIPIPTPTYNPPFTLITDDATEITSHAATLNGTVASEDPNYLVHCLGFEYGTSSGLYTHSPCEGVGLMVSGKRSAIISGLTPVTTYYYRMYTVEKVGSAYGDEKSFTTLTATPTVTPAPVCDAASIEASPKTMKLKGGENGNVTVAVICADGSPGIGEPMTAKIKSGKRCVSVTPLGQNTDAGSQAIFTITATKETGNAKVKFKIAGGLKTTVTVKVRRERKQRLYRTISPGPGEHFCWIELPVLEGVQYLPGI